MVVHQGGQNICGVSIGVICLDSKFPKPPGHIKNPSSLPFTVLYETVQGASVPDMINNPSSEFFEPFIEAAKRLEAEGVRAITGSCGFMAMFQKELAAAVNVPVFSSSLIQVPLMYHLTGCKGPVGVLTADSKNLTNKHFEAVGAENIPVAVMGMENSKEFREVILENKRTDMNLEIISSEVLSAAKKLKLENPKLSVLVMECTDLPPYAHVIQQELQVPVCDLTTLAIMVNNIILREPFDGFMPA